MRAYSFQISDKDAWVIETLRERVKMTKSDALRFCLELVTKVYKDNQGALPLDNGSYVWVYDEDMPELKVTSKEKII